MPKRFVLGLIVPVLFRSVKIFDVREGQQTLSADLKGHEGPVWQVAWAHPRFGNILASCSYDRRVFIWQEGGGQWSKIYEYTNHESSVNSVQWAPHDHGLVLALRYYKEVARTRFWKI